MIQIPTLVIGSSILTVVSILTVFVCESVTIFITEIEVSLRKFNKKICKDAKKNRMKLRTAQQISASKEMSHMVTFYSGDRELCIDSLNSFFIFQQFSTAKRSNEMCLEIYDSFFGPE